jgi:hypothetical protein
MTQMYSKFLNAPDQINGNEYPSKSSRNLSKAFYKIICAAHQVNLHPVNVIFREFKSIKEVLVHWLFLISLLAIGTHTLPDEHTLTIDNLHIS